MTGRIPSSPAVADRYRDEFLEYLSQTVPGRKDCGTEAQRCTVVAPTGRVLDSTSHRRANVGHANPDVVAAVANGRHD